jgi:hypothetical protein
MRASVSLVFLAIVMTACDASPTASPPPPASLVSATPSADPSTAPTRAPEASAPTGFELMRTTASVEMAFAPDGLPLPLAEGSLVVEIEQDLDPDRHLVAGAEATTGFYFGWIPAVANGTAVLEAAELICPEGEINVPILHRLGAAAALCAGGQPFEFEAFAPGACGVADVLTTGEPAWLNPTSSGGGIMLYAEPGAQGSFEPPASGVIFARVAPGVDLANCDQQVTGRFYRLSAHFDDPAAETCRTQVQGDAGMVDEPPEVSVARCRLEMVITDREP